MQRCIHTSPCNKTKYGNLNFIIAKLLLLILFTMDTIITVKKLFTPKAFAGIHIL